MSQIAWMLNLLPEWVWIITLGAGIAAYVLARLVPMQSLLLKISGALLVVISCWMLGASNNNAMWEARVKELEAKITAAEAASKQENIVIQEKIIKQKEFIKGKTQFITEYVDREILTNIEIIKYVDRCPVPLLIIDAHNAAAAMNKAIGETKK